MLVYCALIAAVCCVRPVARQPFEGRCRRVALSEVMVKVSLPKGDKAEVVNSHGMVHADGS